MQAHIVAEQLNGSLHGNLHGLAADKLELSRLISPEQAHSLNADALAPDSVAVVVIPNQESFLALQALDIPLLLVVPKGTPVLGKFPLLMVDDMRLSFARLSRMLSKRPAPAEGVHPSAVIHPKARVALDVAIGANTVIETGAVIERGSVIGANCSIGHGTHIGKDCRLHSNVTVYDGINIGNRVHLASGVVIGADSFGYAIPKDGNSPQRIAHTGTVILEDDVEIDANSTVDRGTLEATRIGAGTKIGALCSVAHNAQIGKNCLIVGSAAIAGSAVLGDRVQISGQTCVFDHFKVGNDAKIAAGSIVIHDVAAGETVFGYPAKPTRVWAKEKHLQSRLAKIWAFVKPQLKKQ